MRRFLQENKKKTPYMYVTTICL